MHSRTTSVKTVAAAAYVHWGMDMNDQALRKRFSQLQDRASGPDLETILARLRQGGLIQRQGDAWVATEIGKSVLKRLAANSN